MIRMHKKTDKKFTIICFLCFFDFKACDANFQFETQFTTTALLIPLYLICTSGNIDSLNLSIYVATSESAVNSPISSFIFKLTFPEKKVFCKMVVHNCKNCLLNHLPLTCKSKTSSRAFLRQLFKRQPLHLQQNSQSTKKCAIVSFLETAL